MSISPRAIAAFSIVIAAGLSLSSAASATTYGHYHYSGSHHSSHDKRSKHKSYSSKPTPTNCCSFKPSDITATSTNATSGTDLDGATLKLDHAYDDGTGLMIKSTVTAEVAAGAEASFYNILDFDITGDLINIYATGHGIFSERDFNGFVITDLNDELDSFTSFEALSGGDFENVVTKFDANTLYVNFGEAGTFLCGDHLSLRVGTTPLPLNANPAAVPLPGALPLLIGGLGLLGWHGGRRKS